MRKKICVLATAMAIVPGGCAKKIETIPLDNVVITEPQIDITISNTTSGESKSENTENSTTGDVETETETETEETTTKKKEPGDNRYGIDGLDLYEFGDDLCVYGDISHVGSLSAGSKNKDGIISNLKLYDLRDNMWLATYDLETDEKIKKVISSVSAIDLSIINTVTVSSYVKDAEEKPLYDIRKVGGDLWFAATLADRISATNYSGAAQRHNALMMPVGVEGFYRDGNNSFYFVSDGFVYMSSPNDGGTPTKIELEREFVVKELLAIHDYDSSSGKAIVYGTDTDGKEKYATIDVDTGDIHFTGDIPYQIFCDDGRLVVKQPFDTVTSELKIYRSFASDYSVRGYGDMFAKSLSDGTTLVYYFAPYADGVVSLYLYKLSADFELIANSKFEMMDGASIAGEVVMTNEGHMIIPIEIGGHLVFYEWNCEELHPDLPQIIINEAKEAREYY